MIARAPVGPGGRERVAPASAANLETTAFAGRPQLASAPLRAVSTVAFAVGGTDAFERTVTKAVDWMRGLNPVIPTDARGGTPFDVGGAGVPLARSVTLSSEYGRLWSATIDVPDAAVPGRTWVTEITVGERPGIDTHFGSRLFNVSSGIDAPFIPSVPKVARWILRDLACATDGVPLASEPTLIDDRTLDQLIALLTKPTRRLPVVVVAEPLSRPLAAIPEAVAARLPGAAHVVTLTDRATQELTRIAGRELSVFDGAARMYLPGFTLEETDPYRHPLWICWPNHNEGEYADEIISRAIAFAASRGSEAFPRFQAVREAAAAIAIEAKREDSSGEEIGKLYQDENDQLRNQLQELRAEQNLWLADAESERSQAASTISELKADMSRMRSQVETLRAAMNRSDAPNGKTALGDIGALSSWANANLGPDIWFAPKAIKTAESCVQYRDPERIGDALRMLDDLYVPMRMGDAAARVDYEARLAELGIEDAACFSRANDILNYGEYGVMYRGRRLWCDRHLKHGGGTDPRSMFRIYFHWHADERRVLVGHLPTHLDNNLTN